jgi:hypothetical protein
MKIYFFFFFFFLVELINYNFIQENLQNLELHL